MGQWRGSFSGLMILYKVTRDLNGTFRNGRTSYDGCHICFAKAFVYDTNTYLCIFILMLRVVKHICVFCVCIAVLLVVCFLKNVNLLVTF